MKLNLQIVKDKIKSLISGLISSLKEMPLQWLIFSFVLFALIVLVRFPLNRVIERIMADKMKSADFQVEYKGFKHSFPLNFSFQSFQLKGKDDLKLDLYDVAVKLNASVIFQKTVNCKIIASGFNLKSDKAFLRSNLEIVLNLENMNQGMSKISGDYSILLNQADFKDLQVLLKENPKTSMVAGLLGDKLPKELKFSKIDFSGKLAKKELSIDGKINGSEIIGNVKGKVMLKEDSFLNSSLQVIAQLDSKSPIWNKFNEEKNILKGMDILDSAGELKLPIVGTIKSPKVNLEIKSAPGQNTSMAQPPKEPDTKIPEKTLDTKTKSAP